MSKMHVPNEGLEKGYRNTYTVLLGTENLEQQEKKMP